MKTWVVTGGAATGKSRFCAVLQAMSPGLCLASSDAVVHELLTEAGISASVSEAFGPKVLGTDGTVNRTALRETVFSDSGARQTLEKLLHPAVFERLQASHRKALDAGAQLFVAEIPLFYEAGSTFPADLVIVVAAGSACQLQRMINERGLDKNTASRILAAQLPLESKLERAQAVVWNEGAPELLKAQAQILLDQLSLTQ